MCVVFTTQMHITQDVVITNTDELWPNNIQKFTCAKTVLIKHLVVSLQRAVQPNRVVYWFVKRVDFKIYLSFEAHVMLTLTETDCYDIYTFFFPQESSSTWGWFWKAVWVVCSRTPIYKTATLKNYFLNELQCFKIKSARQTMCLLNQRLK